MATRKPSKPSRLSQVQDGKAQRLALVQQAVSAYTQGAAELNDAKATAERLIGEAQSGMAVRVYQAFQGAAPITAEQWDEDCKAPLRDALEAAGYAKARVNVISSEIKVAALAITNGMRAPRLVASDGKAAERSLKDYVAACRAHCYKSGVLTEGKGGKKGKSGRRGKVSASDQGATGSSKPRALQPLDRIAVIAEEIAALMSLGDEDVEALKPLLSYVLTTTEGQDAFCAWLQEAGRPSKAKRSRF